MKLHETYPLVEMLNALTAASETPRTALEEMKKQGVHTWTYVSFEPEGMLTTSPYARVTLTRKSSTTANRWEGYMETSLYNDGPKQAVAVQLKEYAVSANDGYSKLTIYTD